MVRSFSYGDWGEICRNVPSMSVCNLFLFQQLSQLSPSSFPAALALPDRSADPAAFDVALASAGVGVKAVCAIPRMASAGGYPGYAGNAANIAFCALAVIVGVYLAVASGRRQAAVARTEMRIFFTLFALQALFQLLSTGSFIRQNTGSLVWVTAIELGLTLILFWTLVWTSFLCLQVLEDGTLASLLPYVAVTVVLFIGFTYICLDTAFSVSGYFNTPPETLHNNWIFTILIVLCGAFLLVACVINSWVSGWFLREKRPLVLYALSLLAFALSQGAFWALSQRICIGSGSRVDGSFLSTLFNILSVVALYFAWKTVTEDSWDEVHTQSGGTHSRQTSDFAYGGGAATGSHGSRGAASSRYSYQPGGAGAPSQYTAYSGPVDDARYMQQTSPLQSAYPYSDAR